MAETFFVRLADAGTVTWGAFDAVGRLVGPLGRGNLESARTASAGRRCVVLVSAVDVLAAEAVLPSASQARLRQIVPFSLEESLATDVEQMVFAIGAKLPAGATQVAAVARERMESWLGQLREVGLTAHALYSEADGIPDTPATLVLVIEGDRISGRKPGRAPFMFEGLALADVLSVIAVSANDESELRHVRVFADAAGHARFSTELDSLDSRFASADVKILRDGAFPHLAATIAQRPGTNLLQGAYAPKSNWSVMLKPWRLAASLAAASLVLALLLQGAEFWRLNRADAALGDAAASACQRVVGDSSTSGCQREIRQRLGATGGGTAEGFLSTLAAIASSQTGEARLDALSYRNRALDLQLVAPSVGALEEFSRALEQTRRFDAEIQTTSQVDEGMEARLRIVGVSP